MFTASAGRRGGVHQYRGIVTVRAVLFDFSGTLFRLEQDESWLAGVTDESGKQWDLEAQTELMRRMTAPTQQVVKLSQEYQQAWDERDLYPDQHRKVYLEVLRSSGLTDPAQAEALYSRLIDPDCWTPYPDAAPVVRRLHEAGVRTAVISNIAFDIRPALDRVGIGGLFDSVLMSYVEGVIKPDPKLFLRACERIDVEPEQALMIGDSVEADGAATEVGCRFAHVEPSPTDERPDALLRAVADHGVSL
ncbi:haloacid dehalogenase superfamily, subfamily IA, variant 3 with third motif having DD or ED/haloacid dehalogenase superfamily, subfamily IA, variant 1 with third motif having Dx(3-4)D or Dx(3-4)E [Actinopolyspora alba]|uniref:Haloacid dehalogenase superfamily, subfamily IA, variant 3 with third motif having DD or ED/haloacid dehalogenase superfamily, subfamily IA, variant 1 with third motif having Dx(3-4)D or Dx(3-4)E n=1 Tax=Actinopolyspora alba TaxID=673379 RepID=A0A1I2C7Y2_9ACTN|nr:haloacid dehalogenase superfamily, subfamily IA, variant 3 with third motif having DD or ED/haloacid dehalogenase superfamily, subfamily IA, variant 1 with third motif having Dx(3-4)D or Dx(3-4)E [Actinopolyspora alba]